MLRCREAGKLGECDDRRYNEDVGKLGRCEGGQRKGQGCEENGKLRGNGMRNDVIN